MNYTVARYKVHQSNGKHNLNFARNLENSFYKIQLVLV